MRWVSACSCIHKSRSFQLNRFTSIGDQFKSYHNNADVIFENYVEASRLLFSELFTFSIKLCAACHRTLHSLCDNEPRKKKTRPFLECSSIFCWVLRIGAGIAMKNLFSSVPQSFREIKIYGQSCVDFVFVYAVVVCSRWEIL